MTAVLEVMLKDDPFQRTRTKGFSAAKLKVASKATRTADAIFGSTGFTLPSRPEGKQVTKGWRRTVSARLSSSSLGLRIFSRHRRNLECHLWQCRGWLLPESRPS